MRVIFIQNPRVLIIGEGQQATGYARVIQSLASNLASEFEIVHFAINDYGSFRSIPWITEPNTILGDRYGCKQLPALLKRYSPDLILICHDYWLYSLYESSLTSYSGKTIAYCPIDHNVGPDQIKDLSSVDALVVYTYYSRSLALQAFEQLLKKNEPMNIPTIEAIGFGVDLNAFYPLPEGRRMSRQKLFPDRPELLNAWIILNANRNSFRKRIDLTIKAFSEFCRGKPDVYLYLHMGRVDFGIDVLDLAKSLGIEERLLLTTQKEDKPNLNDADLNLIYNACDVGLNTCMDEGWGLVSFEHAATGATQIVPNHSACSELWNDVGILIPTDVDLKGNRVVNKTSLVEQMNLLYHGDKKMAYLSKKAMEYATLPQFHWSSISNKWKELILKTLGTSH
ncbi:group 1 glycosyl transferase [Paenibacillus mucilaginosus 3016]|uniref:Group 1 glycosyl transferase n=1 Tax=Paenibacillus mucilaginosus 3016 TaxID=1116391 RepID=H6NNY5_9BACL|nr:group 1 glycosyl transferase [Paenibacillus mucilaginosus 3016]